MIDNSEKQNKEKQKKNVISVYAISCSWDDDDDMPDESLIIRW